MELGKYWVGQIPQQALVLTVISDRTGFPVDLTNYTDVNLIMLDSNNRKVDLSDGELSWDADQPGRITYAWPTNKSLFDKPGDYIFQVEMVGPGVRDFSSAQTLVVRKLGRGRI